MAGSGRTLTYAELELDGPSFGYHNDPEKTVATQHPDHRNWTTIGDLGHLDAEGYLYLTDRKAFIVISGGVNVYPQEIEDALTLHPGVADVAVLGVPDKDLGERVVAFVQPTDADADAEPADDILGFARERTAGYKVPREIHFRATLPRTATGKMVKRTLQQEYAGPPV